MKKRILSILLAMTFVAGLPIVGSAKTFTDLPSTHWAYTDIMAMEKAGIIDGFPDGRFRPEQAVTRAEFTKLLAVTFDLPATGSYYADVPEDAWYREYADDSAPYMLYYPDEDEQYNLKPEDPFVREDAAYAMVELYEQGQAKYDHDILNRFTDTEDITPMLVPYVAIAVDQEMLEGRGDYFDPGKAMTRAEVCKLFVRVIAQRDYPPASGFVTNPPEDSGVQTASTERQVFDLTNQERAANGLQALTWSDDLANVARAHSKDMADNGFFDHNNLKGQSPFDRMQEYGIRYRAAAENIAYGYTSPEAVVEGWMNSPGHRANILNPNLTQLGVGVYGTYWTQNFCTPLD
jgi:uncharacterized protein YkwD